MFKLIIYFFDLAFIAFTIAMFIELGLYLWHKFFDDDNDTPYMY